MAAWLKTVWEQIGTSLWFLPGLLTIGAVLLAWFVLDPRLAAIEGQPVWWLHSGAAEDAANLLASLLTSMITMATLAVSITMVVLTLAAGQLGPRLIRSFMADKNTQLMLGFFLATIVYVVLILRSVSVVDDGDAVPHLAVTLGTGLVILCVFILLFFVHHLARSIVADTMIERVGRALDEGIGQMFVDQRGADAETTDRAGRGAPATLKRSGYVQAIDYGGIVETAREADAVIALHFRPGQHLLTGGCHLRIQRESAGDNGLEKEIAGCIVIGNQRTANQDVEFAVRQLVEIALRAMSTGVNDPFTAIAVVDRLGVALAHVMQRGPATGLWCDADGIVRVSGPTTTFQGLVDAAFNQIRQAGANTPSVLIRLLAVLARLAEVTRSDEHRRVLAEHVHLVAAAGKRSIPDAYDLAALEKRRALALSRLSVAEPLGGGDELRRPA